MERNLNNEFKKLVKEVIAPQLRELDFKKSNTNFNRHVDGIVQLLNIQKSQYNHSERILFTINIGFYNSEVFKISKNKTEVPKFITIDNCFVRGRTGRLIYGHDYWYELSTEKSYESVLNQVDQDLRKYILPLFKYLETLNSIVELIKMDIEKRAYHLISSLDDIAVCELEYGDFNTGKGLLTDLFQNSIIPKTTKHTIVYPDGKKEISWSEPSVNEFYIKKLKRIALRYNLVL